jgi:hypothetical protein
VQVTKTSGQAGAAYNSGSAGAHTHGDNLVAAGSNIVLLYFDVLQCSKDSTGAASSFTDMSAAFPFKSLLTHQNMAKMAANDDYLKFHTIPANSVAFFFQSAAPMSWTQITTKNDYTLRIVSGAGGGSAGAVGLSAGFALAHTHTISSQAGHTHSGPNHVHSLGFEGLELSGTSGNFIHRTGTSLISANPTGTTTWNIFKDVLLAAISSGSATLAANAAHTHTGTSGSALADVTLAYCNIIHCSKDA